MEENKNILKFLPFKSFVHGSFWHKLAELKLDIDCLNDAPKPINAYYTNLNAIGCTLEIDCAAFNQNPASNRFNFTSHGILLNKNTIEDFKNCDKLQLIAKIGNDIWKSIESGEVLSNPSLLSRFILLSFADLKKHNYYYWFAFPTICEPMPNGNKFQLISNYFSAMECDSIANIYLNNENFEQNSFFLLHKQSNDFIFKSLASEIDQNNKIDNFKETNLENIYFCFSDPSPNDNAGWPLRLFLLALLYYCPNLHGKCIKVISIRVKNGCSIENSILFDVELPNTEIKLDGLKWIGWEPNQQGKLIPKMAAMASSMDPDRLAKNSVNLNLKLMKWRLMPDLDLQCISTTKCLLLGAGTLGCSVARNLLGWGVTTITFVDYGKVSYSNPARQSLFTHADALNGGQEKAKTAAKRLKEICPHIITTGHNIHIPMPGHTVGESMLSKTLDAIQLLEELIQQHDVIFLLTDSRESRWLPTVLAAYHGKIVLNAALGFDSYLVMRHGSRKDFTNQIDKPTTNIDGLKCINGDMLGCYFCNDITAPGNSLKDRTLDQQCTVTRPGVSNIAGSLAVELLVSILQHQEKECAPAYMQTISKQNESDDYRSSIPEGILGILPHSIRGMLSTYNQILPATEKFSQCIACSKIILNEYHAKKNEFILKVLESAKYLEDLTGITELVNADQEIYDYSDFEMSD